VPLSIGGYSIMHGPHFLGRAALIPTDLDSHFRYLSGIFFAVGLAFATCIPDIERKGPRFRLLSGLIVCGGLSRVVSLIAVGAPGAGHRFGLAMELCVVPLLALWQWRVAQRLPSIADPASADGA
jgi:hypothetical protein